MASLYRSYQDLFGIGSSWARVHITLLAVRFLCIFLTGYPHPDEFFQSPEIAAADIFEFNVFIPWEFADLSNPCRSIISPLIGSGLGYTILYGLSYLSSSIINGFTLLIFPRIIMFLLSLVIDYATATISRWKGDDPGPFLLILGSSWTMLVMHTRPFSNILESFFVCVAILLFLVPQEVLTGPLRSWRFVMLGAVFSLGIFTRFTFVFFFFPIALGVLHELLYRPCFDLPLSLWSLMPSNLNVNPVTRTNYFTKSVILGLTGVFSVAGTIVVLDSVYFESFQLTVMNSFLYNLDSKNLAEHGLHPRYLHSLVNMHILYGPLYLFGILTVMYSILTSLIQLLKHPKLYLDESKGTIRETISNNEKGHFAGNRVNQLRSRIEVPSKMNEFGNYHSRGSSDPNLAKIHHNSERAWIVFLILFGCILFGCGMLSIAQHQEPRFLLPLLLPLVLLFGDKIYQKKPLFISWIMFNIAIILFFGIMHQGGVVPSLMYIQHQSNTYPGTMGGIPVDENIGADVIYFKTFMPPRFLVAQPKSGQYPITIHDPGRSEEKLALIIEDLKEKYCHLGESKRKAFILYPSLVELPGNIKKSEKITSFWPHFSSEDAPQSVIEFYRSTLDLHEVEYQCN